MAQSKINLKALGLNTSPNPLDVPDGSMSFANNVVIRRDNTIQARRGFKQYAPLNGPINQLIEYKGRILAHYNEQTLAFDSRELNGDEQYIFDNFNGTYSPTQTGLRIKSLEANKNLYFTTSDGIKKISASSADQFTTASGYIKNAGALKALDVSAILSIEQGQTDGFLPNDSSVAYRVVWGYKDANDNLLLGSPSERFVIYNYLSDVIKMDFNTLLTRLDSITRNNGANLLSDTNYASTLTVSLTSDDPSLKTSVVNLATKLDEDITVAGSSGSPPLGTASIAISGTSTNNTATITFSTGNANNYFTVGDYIWLTGFTPATKSANGEELFSGTMTFITGYSGVVTAAGTYSVASGNYRQIVGSAGSVSGISGSSLNDTIIDNPATSEQLRTIYDSLDRILSRLRLEKNAVITSSLIPNYLNNYNLTTSANVKLNITIPDSLPSDYFVQVYRSRNFTAQGIQTLGIGGFIEVTPDDELRLCYEAFPTTAEISAGYLEFTDIYPESLVLTNTNLYTNPVTGEGIQNANEPPPFAKDIVSFKNTTFYLNTKTKQKITSFALLGTENLDATTKLTIGNTTSALTYNFTLGVAEVTPITFTSGTVADYTGDHVRLYAATLDGANDLTEIAYTFWFDVTGSDSAPVVSGTDIYVRVPIQGLTTANQVAQKFQEIVNTKIYDFTATVNTATVTVTNINVGNVTNATTNAPATIGSITQGTGENAATQTVLLVKASSQISAAQAIDITARSLVRVINKQSGSAINAYYISNENTLPGRMVFEAKSLSQPTFYVQANNTAVGTSFTPDISPQYTTITGNTVANPTVVTTSSAHGLNNGDVIVITGGDVISGVWTITKVSATEFSISLNAASNGGASSWSIASFVNSSNNEEKPNRVYYSKANQPESVPLLNYINLGAEDKPIARGMPLRDSLFVFKQDGLYRLSGESAPFVSSLFDSSAILIASDSLSIANNNIYGWFTQGIATVSETGVGIISRPIDNIILKLASSTYPNFSTITWGTGYDSDNSYVVYTNSNPADTYATIGYRFSNLTNSWTSIDRAERCGKVMSFNDKLYMGDSSRDFIVEERKSFTRTDYADDETITPIQNNSIYQDGQVVGLIDVESFKAGDVILQEQTVTVYKYNALLQKLDLDSGSGGGYYAALVASTGNDMRAKIVALAARLDAQLGGSTYSGLVSTKSGTITSNSAANPTVVLTSAPHGLVNDRLVTITGANSSIPSIVDTYPVTVLSSTTFSIPVNVTTSGGAGLSYSTAPNSNNFEDMMACYNAIINQLNADTTLVFANYQLITGTTAFEAIITNVNKQTNELTLNLPLQFIPGTCTVFSAFDSEVRYTGEDFGDQLSFKQIYQATFMFTNTAFTECEVGFATDLKPAFNYQAFQGQGNGIYGHYTTTGFGYGNYGGLANGTPFRTLVPRDAQRCRYMLISFVHSTAREEYALLGYTLTGNMGQSERAYR
jgi:hypothetical protein